MITTHKVPYRRGELRIGWASWDNGKYEQRSIKYAYRDSSGKISRGSPEVPFDVLVAMVLLAAEQKELDDIMPKTAEADDPPHVSQISPKQLADEKDVLTVALMRLQGLIADIPWANWQPIYDQIGGRFEAVKAEMSQRSTRT